MAPTRKLNAKQTAKATFARRQDPPGPGTFKIVNVLTQSSVRANTVDGPIFVENSSEDAGPGPYEVWQLGPASENSFTLYNVGLTAYAVVIVPENRLTTVTTLPDPDDPSYVSSFAIESDGGGIYVIKLPNQNLEWTVGSPGVPYGEISPQPAAGEEFQQFTLTQVGDYN